MFLQYYGMREQPFGVTPNPRFLYFSATHREALASLFYGIESGCGFLTLIAAPGMGKTTLLFHLLEKLRGSAQTVFLFQTQCGSREFFRYLLTDLGADAGEQNLARMHESLNAVLLRNARVGRRVVLVIDEAQNLEDSVLETVRLLSDFETPQAKLLQIVLAGQPQLADKLSNPGLMQLRQRISIVSRLHPFTRVETMVYLEYRLSLAGYSGPPLFGYGATELIAAHSGGIPRNINNICFNALTLGYAKRQKQIDASIVNEVLADLDIEGLGTHPLSPGLMARDSLSSFDGLAPTDEATYQEFHTAVRSAWGKGLEGKTQEGLAESGSVLIKPGNGDHPLETVFQTRMSSQTLSETLDLERNSAEETAAYFGSMSTTSPIVSQVLAGEKTHDAPHQQARSRTETGSVPVAPSEVARLDPSPSPAEVRASDSENRQAPAASPSQHEPHAAPLRVADERRSQQTSEPNLYPMPSGTRARSKSLGTWARVMSRFLPRRRKKVVVTGDKRQAAGVRTMIVVAFALIVGGSLLTGRVYEAVQVNHNPAPATSASNPVNPSSTIDPNKISQDAKDVASERPQSAHDDDPMVITLEYGQTLSELSVRYLGRFNREVTQQIQRLNPVIKNPDLIFAGMHLRLPVPPTGSDGSASSSEAAPSAEEHSR